MTKKKVMNSKNFKAGFCMPLDAIKYSKMMMSIQMKAQRNKIVSGKTTKMSQIFKNNARTLQI